MDQQNKVKDEWTITKADIAMVELLLNHPTEAIIRMVLDSTKATPSQSVERFEALKRELGLKIHDVIRGIYSDATDFVVGQSWIAKLSENGFYKGKEATVTKVLQHEVVLDDMFPMKKEEVRQNFEKKVYKSKK